MESSSGLYEYELSWSIKVKEFLHYVGFSFWRMTVHNEAKRNSVFIAHNNLILIIDNCNVHWVFNRFAVLQFFTFIKALYYTLDTSPGTFVWIWFHWEVLCLPARLHITHESHTSLAINTPEAFTHTLSAGLITISRKFFNYFIL
jgi:hypothetical protein